MQLDPLCTFDIPVIAARQLTTMSNEEMDNDLSLNAFFGSVYVIHLPQAEERLKRLLENFREIGIKDFVLFPACDGKRELPGEITSKMYSLWGSQGNLATIEKIRAIENQQKAEAGCFMSHFRVIQEIKTKFEEALVSYERAKLQGKHEAMDGLAKEVRRYSSVLILEDDNAFGFLAEDKKTTTLKGCGLLLRLALMEMPKQWHMLYFMAQSQFPSQFIGRFLRRICGTKGANAYAVHYPFYAQLVEHLGAIEDPAVKVIYPLDHQLSQLHPDYVCLAITPSIAYQTAGFSSIHSKMITESRQARGDVDHPPYT
ncbi:MAG: hypothetical protein LLG04_11915 [Parachlamydia sp.]|nr:hypothetical protein [Parachlamydia sp.]